MDTLKHLVKKYKINLSTKSPIELPQVSRADLARLFSDLGFTKGAEVGTWTGVYTNVLCGTNKSLKLIGVDINSNTSRKVIPDNCKLVKMTSLDAAKRVVDSSLDFVYLDLHQDLASSINNFLAWAPKVRSGGIIAGHDFFRYPHKTNVHTRDAVMSYTGVYHIHPWFVAGLEKDRIRSWFWVKA